MTFNSWWKTKSTEVTPCSVTNQNVTTQIPSDSSGSVIARQVAGYLTNRAKKQPGAILLNGGWGVGKTHLWFNQIRNEISLPKVYLSLFGIKSSEEMKEKLALAVFSELASSTDDWAGSFIKSVPATLVKAIRAFAKNKLGEEAAQILEALNLKIDPLHLFVEGTVVCLDDFERSKMDIEEVLGVINFLLEHKAARVLIVANQDYLNSSAKLDDKSKETFKKFKEKVIWQVISFYTPLDQVFDDFVVSFASENQALLQSCRSPVLETLSSGRCSNLRTLQKVIRMIDNLSSIKRLVLEEEHVRFLTALIAEDSQNGLVENAQIYRANPYSNSVFLKDKKERDSLTGDNKVSFEFYVKYFETTQNIGFSPSLHSFVRTGIINESELRREISPDEQIMDSGTRLLREFNHSPWFLWSDLQINDLANRIETYLRDDGATHPWILIYLFDAVIQLNDRINSSVQIDLKTVTQEKIISNLRNNTIDEKNAVFHFKSKEEQQNLDTLVNFYLNERAQVSANELKNQFLTVLKSSEVPDLFSNEVRYSPHLVSILTDNDILDAVDSLLDSHPAIHFHFYSRAIHRLKENNASNKIPLKTIEERLTNAMLNAKDVSTQKRLSVLMEETKKTA